MEIIDPGSAIANGTPWFSAENVEYWVIREREVL
jgi:hypothetical protein